MKMWKNWVLRCQGKIREKSKSLAFDEKTKINISKDCLTKSKNLRKSDFCKINKMAR